MRTLVVCGLGREARIAAGPGVITVAGGGVRSILEDRLDAVPRDGLAAVVSFGLAGALDPSLRVGDLLVPDRVLSGDGGDWPTARELQERWSGLGLRKHERPGSPGAASVEAPPTQVGGRRLEHATRRISATAEMRGAPQDEEERGGFHPVLHPDVPAEGGPRSTQAGWTAGASLLGVDAPVLGVAEKTRLRAETGAGAVDMESHVAAGYAARHGLPFAALRVISDGADHALPAIAGRAMRPDGSVDVWRVIAGLARDPGQLPALLATARDAGRAFRVLRRVRGLLGPGFGLQL